MSRIDSQKLDDDITDMVHETALDLYQAGGISKQTLREFDALCLRPVTPMSSSDIQSLRERESVSQAVFALHLNVSKSLVSQWERGEKKPGGAALKLLNLVARNGLSVLS